MEYHFFGPTGRIGVFFANDKLFDVENYVTYFSSRVHQIERCMEVGSIVKQKDFLRENGQICQVFFAVRGFSGSQLTVGSDHGSLSEAGIPCTR